MSSPIVELPTGLRLPFLSGLTAKELIAKCDWHIESHRASFERDRELGLLHYYDGHIPGEALCCLVPALNAARPKSDDGMPLALARWLLRRAVGEAALPQPPLAFVATARRRNLTVSQSEVRS